MTSNKMSVKSDHLNIDKNGKMKIISTTDSYTGAELQLVGSQITNYIYSHAIAIKKAEDDFLGAAALEVIQGDGTLVLTSEDGDFVQLSANGGLRLTEDISTAGNINATGTVTGSNIQSDRNLKKNIKDSTINALEVIKQIEHREFDWKKDDKHINTGYIAQELEEIDANFVFKQNDTYYIDFIPLLATATKAIQEQQEIIESLEARIVELEGVR